MKKQPTKEQLKATDKVYKLRENPNINDIKLAEACGVSKVTFYTRLKASNWKRAELALIKTLKL